MQIKKTKFIIIISILIVSLNPINQQFNATGYAPGLSGTHVKIAERAKTLLSNDFPELASVFDSGTNWANVKQGLTDADERCWLFGETFLNDCNIDNNNFGGKNHYLSPTLHLGFPGITDSAAEYVNHFFNLARTYFKSGDNTKAFYYFGFALHVVADTTVPFHSRLVAFSGHTDYESMIQNELHGYISGISTKIYSFSGSSVHSDETKASGWVDYNAHYSYGYYSDVDNVNLDVQVRKSRAQTLLRRAVGTSVGFLKFFLSTSLVTGIEVESFSGSLSSSGSSQIVSRYLYSGEYTVVLSGNSKSDFDLYARWTFNPTTSKYNARGYSGDSLEYFELSGGGNLKIMIRAYRGGGNWKLTIISGGYVSQSEQSGSLSSKGSTQVKSSGGPYQSPVRGWGFLSGPDGNDFDLYAKWGSAPTTSSHDAKGYTSKAQEVVYVGEYNGYPRLYLMSRAYSGSGSYRVLILLFN